MSNPFDQFDEQDTAKNPFDQFDAPTVRPTPTQTAPQPAQQAAPAPQQAEPVTAPVETSTGGASVRRQVRQDRADRVAATPAPGMEPGYAVPYDAEGLQQELQRGVPANILVDTLIRQGASTLQVGDQPFDLVGAREAGVDPREIMHILTTGRPFMDMPEGFGGQMTGVAAGINTSLSTLLGLPVDAINNSPRLLNLLPGEQGFTTVVDRPFLGSESIRGGMNALGVTTYEDVNDLPPDYRPAGYAGEVIGGGAALGLGLGATALNTARATANSSTARQIVDPILDTFRRNPGQSTLIETGSVFGAAQGAATAEFLFPDNPVVRMGAEVLGGMFSPVSLAARVGGGASTGIDRFASTYFGGKAGQQRAARQSILRAINETGENPEQVVALLNKYIDNPVEGIPLTAGQASGSPTLLAVERAIGAKSQQFFGYQQETIESAFTALRQASDSIAADGSPEALRIAARMRERYFNDLIASRIAVAQREAEFAASRFADADGVDASVRAASIMDGALADVRSIERSLWEQIPSDTASTGENTVAALASLRSTLLDEEAAPGLAEAFVRRVAGDSEEDLMAGLSGDEAEIARMLGVPSMADEGGTTAGELLRFRSRMLALGRDASARGERDLARQFNTMADGALSDLDAIDLPEAATARDFSRQLNETFRTRNLEQMQGRTRQGADAVRDEEFLGQSFGAGRTRGDLNIAETERAAEFADEATGTFRDLPTDRLPNMQGSVDEFLRSTVNDLRDPVTGAISEQRLERFVQENPRILERYPNLRDDIRAASSASANVRATEQTGEQSLRTIEQRAVFSRLVNDEDPSRVVGGVLTGSRPEAEFTQMARLAQRSGDDAVRGLEAATMDYATSRATNADGRFNFGTFRETLTRPPNARGKSPIELMVDNGVMLKEDADRLVTILDEAVRLTDVQNTRIRIDPTVIDEPSSALFDFAQRVVGSQIGAASVAGQLSGSSLVAAGAGSRTVRSIADRVPRAKTLDALIAISKDPVAMRDLLLKAGTPAQEIARDRRLSTFLLQQGIIDVTEDEVPSELPADETERMLQEEQAGPLRLTVTPEDSDIEDEMLQQLR